MYTTPTDSYPACTTLSLHAALPISGFGHTGPHSKRPAYDMVVQAMGGIMSITGQPGGEPTRVGMSIGDVAAGLYTTIGINAALYDRTVTDRKSTRLNSSH